ncbi:MAG: pentapeptide repeat-containing protein [Candidatus Magasanikbacteria bacterium]|nr:pentapeptide repeat-containing protein [Candidatus Magasanikbacteria bacterium]
MPVFGLACYLGRAAEDCRIWEDEMLQDELIQRYQRGERDFSGVKLQGDSPLETDLMGCVLAGAIFIGITLRGAFLNGSNLQCVDFTGSDLSDTHFVNTDISGANMRSVTLQGAEVTAAQLATTRNLEHAFMDPGRFADAVAAGYKVPAHTQE